MTERDEDDSRPLPPAPVSWLVALTLAVSLVGGCPRPVIHHARRVPDGWWRIAAQHVAVTSDLPHETTRELTWAFEDVERALRVAFPECVGDDAPELVEVVAFGSASQYRRVAGTVVANAFFVPARGLFASVPPRVVMQGDRLAVVRVAGPGETRNSGPAVQPFFRFGFRLASSASRRRQLLPSMGMTSA